MLDMQSEDGIQSTSMQQAMLVNPFEQPQVPLNAMEQSTVKSRTLFSQSWPKSRLARIKKLQVRIATGAYHVETVALAESMLNNETHFFESSLERH